MIPSSLAFLDTRTLLLYTGQNCAEPLSPFPLSFAFPEHIPGEHVAPYHKEIKQLFHHRREAEMYISTVWLRSLAEGNKWLTSLEDPATSVRLLSDFSTLKICAALQGQESQLGSIAGTGCTIPIGSALSLPLSPHLQSPAPAPLWPQDSVQSHHWCMLSGWGGGNIFTFKSSSFLSHVREYILSEGTPPLCWPLVQLLQSFWPYTFSKALPCFLPKPPFPG